MRTDRRSERAALPLHGHARSFVHASNGQARRAVVRAVERAARSAWNPGHEGGPGQAEARPSGGTPNVQACSDYIEHVPLHVRRSHCVKWAFRPVVSATPAHSRHRPSADGRKGRGGWVVTAQTGGVPPTHQLFFLCQAWSQYALLLRARTRWPRDQAIAAALEGARAQTRAAAADFHLIRPSRIRLGPLTASGEDLELLRIFGRPAA